MGNTRSGRYKKKEKSIPNYKRLGLNALIDYKTVSTYLNLSYHSFDHINS